MRRSESGRSHKDEWHEEFGPPVLWWTNPICEPPYAGGPNDDDFLHYMEWWTPLPDCKAVQAGLAAALTQASAPKDGETQP